MLNFPVQDDFGNAGKSEGLAGKADEVIKGILDPTSSGLSRAKVKEIGDAVTKRETKDGGTDTFHRIIRPR